MSPTRLPLNSCPTTMNENYTEQKNMVKYSTTFSGNPEQYAIMFSVPASYFPQIEQVISVHPRQDDTDLQLTTTSKWCGNTIYYFFIGSNPNLHLEFVYLQPLPRI